MASTAGRAGEAGIKARQEKASKFREDVLPVIQRMQGEGITTLGAIAQALNKEEIPTPRGTGHWSAVQVMRILRAA